MTTTKKSAWRKLAFTVLLVFSLLAGLELALRVSGAVLQAPSDARNRIEPEDAHRLRILALGESTTADYFSPSHEGAWPRQLQIELRKKGIDARVYNEAVGGTNTAIILSHLPDYLDMYRPQIVISMIGINDSYDVRFDGRGSSRGLLVFSSFRLFKAVRLLAERVRALSQCQISFEMPDDRRYQRVVDEGYRLALKSTLSEVEMAVRRSAATDHDVALILTEIGQKFRGDFSRTGSTDEATRLARSQEFNDRAFQLFPLNDNVAFWELNISVSRGPNGLSQGLHAAKELARCGPNVPDNLLPQMGVLAGQDPALAQDPVFASHGLGIGGNSSPTAVNYRRLHDELRLRGIPLIAMQYPTLPLSELEGYFSSSGGTWNGASDIIFVSNEDNFAKALKTHRYEEIFRDRFRGSWGHTTELGHSLIMHQALGAVLRLLIYHPSLRPALSQR